MLRVQHANLEIYTLKKWKYEGNVEEFKKNKLLVKKCLDSDFYIKNTKDWEAYKQ
jgi:hypothetical protein